MIDIFEFMKLAELCFYSQTGVSIIFIERAINMYHDMPEFDKQKMDILRKQLIRSIDGGRELSNIQGKFLARFDPDNQYMVTVKYKENKETRYMYMYEGMYWDGKSMFAPPENIHELVKINGY